MGIFGTSIYENDVFMDVKASCEEMSQEFMNDTNIQKEILDQYSDMLEDPDDAPYVYMAIAQSQMDKGKVLKSTKAMATDAINQYIDYLATAGEDPTITEEMVNSLKTFLEEMEHPVKKKKPRKKPVKCPWKIGDVYALKMEGLPEEARKYENRYLLFMLVDYFKCSNSLYPYGYVMISPNEKKPSSREEIENSYYIMHDCDKIFKVVLMYNNNSDPQNFGFMYINNYTGIPTPQCETNIPYDMLWLYRRILSLEDNKENFFRKVGERVQLFGVYLGKN